LIASCSEAQGALADAGGAEYGNRLRRTGEPRVDESVDLIGPAYQIGRGGEGCGIANSFG
jgi:hypothetical protein